MSMRSLSIALSLSFASLLATPSFGIVCVVDTGGAVGVYPTISSAIMNQQCETIVVHDTGPYVESLLIQNRIDLQIIAADMNSAPIGSMQTGVGTNPQPLITINGSAQQTCINISGSARISIVGFKLKNCGTGVLITNSNDVVIQGNGFVPPFNVGIDVDGSWRCVLAGNRIDGGFISSDGVRLLAKEGLVIDNVIENNLDRGILVAPTSYGNRITNNDVTGSSGSWGIHDQGNKSIIGRNTVMGGSINIFLESPSDQADVVGNDAGGSMACSGCTAPEFQDNI